MKPKVIIFDLDETLTDRTSTIEEFANQFVFRYFPDRVEEADAIKKIFKDADNHGYRDKQEVYHMLVEQLEWNNPPEFIEYVTYFREEMPKYIKPKNHLIETLHFFKNVGIRLAVITNGTVKMQQAKINRLGIQDYFESVVISEEVGIKKPDSRIFSLAIEQMKVLPSEVWFVGDNPTNDVIGATDVGMKAIWITKLEKWEKELNRPYGVIKELKQLVDLYKTL